MSEVILSPRAKLDLGEIWDYTLSQWGVEQAEKFVRELWFSMEHAANNPTKSVDIGDIRRGYRKSKSGCHVIFFKATGDGINVVRILHQRMDFERHF
ncbi:MAG: type II toxin-antitoxin system RelE/ParE family toxin [Deltaproteobacteria bacterium]|nr:MAG: type II toxin-antitoxin system RelE/ParE family toxin [Deltaproteobacteria bacterium]RLB73730.1 MAG: type II toxin-antitoxin system RelE/ParE family toxin [Deltaproteobacteria bacterium]